MKKTTALLLSFLLIFGNVFWNVRPAPADDDQIFGANIQPNVLIAIDTSGSMDDSIPADPYDTAVIFPGTKTAAAVYKRTSPPTLYKNTVAEVPSSSARDALNSVAIGPDGSAAPGITSPRAITSITCRALPPRRSRR